MHQRSNQTHVMMEKVYIKMPDADIMALYALDEFIECNSSL